MRENQKNETSVLTGNSLEKFFTEDSPENNAQQEPKEETGSSLENMFDAQGQVVKTTKEAQKETPSQEEVVAPQKNSYYYDNVISDFLEDGEWEDMVIETEVDGEVVETPLSELKNVDKETFQEIKKHFKQLKDEEFKENYISVEGLDETTKRMVELKKKGGDISSLIQAEVQHVHPLKGIDLEDERVQEAIVRQKLSASGQLSQATIENEIKTLKANLELDKKSNEIVQEINTNFNRFVETEAKRQEEELEAQRQQQKEFRKTLSETIKNFNIQEEKVVKALLDASTKYDSNGLSDVDKAFFEAKQNPELFTKIAFLLTNEELFDKHMGIKIKNKATLGEVKKILNLRKKSSTEQPKVEKKKSGLESFFNDNQQ